MAEDDLPAGGGIPPGFEPYTIWGNFDANIYPLFRRRDEKGVAIGLRVEGKHCNMHGAMHGGALATFVDIGMGQAVHFGETTPTLMVTSSMVIDYLGEAKLGAWIECSARVLKRGRRLIIVDCMVQQTSGDAPARAVARCNATFVPLEGTAKQREPMAGTLVQTTAAKKLAARKG